MDEGDELKRGTAANGKDAELMDATSEVSSVATSKDPSVPTSKVPSVSAYEVPSVPTYEFPVTPEFSMDEDNIIQQGTVHHEEVVMSSSFDVDESRKIRAEQDREFAESLRIDQEKVI